MTKTAADYQREALAVLNDSETKVTKRSLKKTMVEPWSGADGSRGRHESSPLYPDRIRFLRLIETLAPDVLNALAATTNGVRSALQQFHLDVPWIERVAELTVTTWNACPPENRRCFTFRNLRNPRADDPIAEPMAFAPLGAEDWRAWRDGCGEVSYQTVTIAVYTPAVRETVIDGEHTRFKRDSEWIDAIAAEARRQATAYAERANAALGVIPSINEDHMKWLIQYQVLGVSAEKIAKATSRTRQTVMDGLKQAAQAIGLPLRAPSRRGRPRKK